MAKTDIYLASKPRYEILDGLRGVAALMVVLNHGYLAVDFSFVLSGFVVGYAYVAAHPDAPLWQHIAVSAGIVFMAVVVAYGLFKAYDEPVREWLKDHWLHRKKAA